ncbi:recombinase family protein [Actinomadura madurae]
MGRWTGSAIRGVLTNPKYTGYMVWNRRATKKGGRHNPATEWIWSPRPTHEPLVTKDLFEAASPVAHHRQGSRPPTPPAHTPRPSGPTGFAPMSPATCAAGGCSARPATASPTSPANPNGSITRTAPTGTASIPKASGSARMSCWTAHVTSSPSGSSDPAGKHTFATSSDAQPRHARIPSRSSVASSSSGN